MNDDKLARLIASLTTCAEKHITREYRTLTIGEDEARLLLAAIQPVDALWARTEGYILGRNQAADFARAADPVLAQSIRLNWHDSLPPRCPTCSGHGQVPYVERIAEDDARIADVDCPTCDCAGVILPALQPARGDGAVAVDWPLVNTVVSEYVAEYEMLGEDAEGREGCYTPNERERILIADAINGLLSDDVFQDALRLSPTPGGVRDGDGT